MNKEKQAQFGAHTVMYCVMNKKPEVAMILMKNGITLSPTATDKEIAQKVTSLLKTSKKFRQDFLSLYKTGNFANSMMNCYSSMNGGYANASGIVVDPAFDFSTLPSGGTYTGSSTTTTSPTPTIPTTSGSSWWTTDNIVNTLNTGLNAFLTLDKNKTDRAIANSGVQIAQSGTGGASGALNSTPQKDNTVLYVVLSVLGIAVVGGLVFVATKKK